MLWKRFSLFFSIGMAPRSESAAELATRSGRCCMFLMVFVWNDTGSPYVALHSMFHSIFLYFACSQPPSENKQFSWPERLFDLLVSISSDLGVFLSGWHCSQQEPAFCIVWSWYQYPLSVGRQGHYSLFGWLSICVCCCRPQLILAWSSSHSEND